MTKTRIVIVGSRGRMGAALQTCAAHESGLRIAGLVDQGDSLGLLIDRTDVVIDFSQHDATPALVALCVREKKPLVLGTTGHSEDEKRRIRDAAGVIPIVWTSNFSTGVNVLFWLVRKAAEVLGPGYDREIIEVHHRFKKDAPSGTAASLAEILASVRHQQMEAVARHGRVGLVGERSRDEIGIHAVRGGDVVGDHTVMFAASGERVELTHRASSRETLANGALRAARWLVGRPPGLYDMQDVLGLK